MPKSLSPRPTVLGVVGIMASCFFGVLCFCHVVYWVWQLFAFHADKQETWTRITIWLVLGAGAGLTWSWLVWIMYFPKKAKF